MVADLDGDRRADLVCVYPEGKAIVDVALNVGGLKCGRPYQAVNPWAEQCLAAATGSFDDRPGEDLIGLFADGKLRLLAGFKDGKFQVSKDVLQVPRIPKHPGLSSGGSRPWLFGSDGMAFELDIAAGTCTPRRIPKDVVWMQGDGLRWTMLRNGSIGRLDGEKWIPTDHQMRLRASRPAADGGSLVLDESMPTFADAATIRFLADADADGDLDLWTYRLGSEAHTANVVTLQRSKSVDDTDWDHDGLTQDQETALKSDPLCADTDGDGLIDGWEAGEFRGLKLRELGCHPARVDVICLLSRFEGLDDAVAKSEIEKCKAYYAKLPHKNPDGTSGFGLRVIWLDEIKKADQSKPWWELRDALIPGKWRGMVHWMQLTPWGGGQADQLGDGGGCGGGTDILYATFLHEFGHQIGMDHSGFWNAEHNPIYPSLMNYAYSYGLNNSIKNIGYSTGALRNLVLNERQLDEVIPLPFESVKFLAAGPYGYRMKQEGDRTLIDWNWNGVYGERRVRADINYGYSTNAGVRDEVDLSQCGPTVFTHNGHGFILYGKRPIAAKGGEDASFAPDRPGKVVLKKLLEPKKWTAPLELPGPQAIGDPYGISHAGRIWVFVPTAQGLLSVTLSDETAGLKVLKQEFVPDSQDRIPTGDVYKGRLYLLLWNPKNGHFGYRPIDARGSIGAYQDFGFTSTNPGGLTVDTKRDRVVIALGRNQDANRPNRWQIRRFRLDGGYLVQESMAWIEGEGGGCRGPGRLTVLFDGSADAGPEGRLMVFGRGDPTGPHSCGYVATQIADKTIRDGWMVKRYYDEWSQSRSAPSACWWNGEILYVYRWVDGNPSRDGILHVGYRGSGIQPDPMGDHDDVAFFANFGIRSSILYLNPE
ncbi:MAG: hypothetical protein HONBIEJF_02316 [Fimbriimonadaceae bacterium]|nr:hypothetical protein [Fimbriimonadaceae bacterium]